VAVPPVLCEDPSSGYKFIFPLGGTEGTQKTDLLLDCELTGGYAEIEK
jgi:hypothetical protein